MDAWLGLARCEPLPAGAAALLEPIGRRMVDVRAELATVPPAQYAAAVAPADVAAIEQAIDRYQAKLDPLEAFILPGGCRAAAVLHLARAVCRRAERRLVSLGRAEPPAVSAVADGLSEPAERPAVRAGPRRQRPGRRGRRAVLTAR